MSADVSYEEYLQRVRAQEQRDRDRFTGQDSHEPEPLYAADTGQQIIPPAGITLTPDEIDQMVETWNNFAAAVTEKARQTVEVVSPVYEQHLADQRRIMAAPKRHTYPRQHGQWWVQRSKADGNPDATVS